MDQPTTKPCARRVLPLALLVFTASFVTATPARAQTSPQAGNGATGAVVPSADPVPDQYIVTLRDDRPEAAPLWASALTSRYGGEVRDVYDDAVQGFSAHMSEEDAAALAADPAVASVEEDGLVHATVTQQNPPSWGLDRIDQTPGGPRLDGAYSYQTTGSSVHAYVIDTGVRITHADFGARATNGWDFVDNDADTNPVGCTNPTAQHGTHVAATLGGSTFGVAKGVSITSVRVLRCDGTGTMSSVIAGVDWVTGNATRPAVANMSLAGAASATLDEAVQQSIASGITYVVAAGNAAGDACTRSPARVSAALTVAATDANDARASFSSFGSCVDVFAPGVNITSASSTGDTATVTLSGTSMAAPHVSGVVACFLEASPGAQPAEVASVVLGGAVSGVVSNAGSGSPNRLVNTQFIDAPAPPPAPDPAPLLASGAAPLTSAGVLAAPVAAVTFGGTARVFTRGVDNALYHFQSPSGSSTSWVLLGGYLTSDPAPIASSAGIDIFVRGGDNGLYQGHISPNGTWTGYRALGGYLTSDPAPIASSAGIDIFVRGGDNGLYQGHISPNGTWTGYRALGGYLTSDPAPIASSAGMDIFVRGGDNGLYQGHISPYGIWTGYRALGGYLTSDPAPIASSAGMDIFVRGGDNGLYQGHISPDGTWTGYRALGGYLTSDPAPIASSAGMDVFVRGGDNGLYQGHINPDGTWTGYQARGGVLTSNVAVAADDAGLAVFARGFDNAVDRGVVAANGTWTSLQPLLG